MTSRRDLRTCVRLVIRTVCCLLAGSALPSVSLLANPKPNAGPGISAGRVRPPAGGRPIVIGLSYAFQSRVLHGARRINVQLPEHYGERGRKFPVLFLLDGGEREDFHHIGGLARINAAYGQGQEMIVVGIEGVDRRHDLTSPSSVPSDLKAAPTSGGAATYRKFLVDELKPWIAGRYATDGHYALIGESLAGLFVLETLLEAPGSFNDYIAVSPSLWWNAGALSRRAASLLKARRYSGQRAWIAFEEPAPPPETAARERAQQDAVAAALAEAAPDSLHWTVTRLPESHATVYHSAALGAFRGLYGATRE